MRIMQVLDTDSSSGAAVAGYRLAQALVDSGHDVVSAVKHRGQGEEDWRIETQNRSRPLRLLTAVSPPRIAQSMEVTAANRWLIELAREFSPDAINIHSLLAARSSGFNIETTTLLRRFAPVIWTLHDMWTFTGRCIFNDDCGQFVKGCSKSCPTPSEFPALEPFRIHEEWKRRQAVFAGDLTLAAVAPSQWMANQAKVGLWGGHRVEVIPNGLPLDVFRPVAKQCAREILGIEKDAFIVLCGSLALDYRRKGMSLLVDALRQMDIQDVTLVSMGRGNLSSGQLISRYVPLGFLEDDRLKAAAYSAADIYVHCAIADNLPNMVMESLACGTPVVAFSVGGVPEMVRDGRTGWLSTEINSNGLAQTLSAAINAVRHGLDLRSECRAVAENEYSPELQGGRYSMLFEELIGSARPTA